MTHSMSMNSLQFCGMNVIVNHSMINHNDAALSSNSEEEAWGGDGSIQGCMICLSVGSGSRHLWRIWGLVTSRKQVTMTHEMMSHLWVMTFLHCIIFDDEVTYTNLWMKWTVIMIRSLQRKVVSIVCQHSLTSSDGRTDPAIDYLVHVLAYRVCMVEKLWHVLEYRWSDTSGSFYSFRSIMSRKTNTTTTNHHISNSQPPNTHASNFWKWKQRLLIFVLNSKTFQVKLITITNALFMIFQLQ